MNRIKFRNDIVLVHVTFSTSFLKINLNNDNIIKKYQFSGTCQKIFTTALLLKSFLALMLIAYANCRNFNCK